MTSETHPDKSFTFIQLNFWEGRMYYPLVKFLNREQPHIFSVQELLTGSVIVNPSFFIQEELLEKKFFDAVSKGPAKPCMMRHNVAYDMLCSTLVRQPVTIRATHHIPLYRDQANTSDREAYQAAYTNLVHTEIELDGQIVHILNHHGRLVIEGRMGSEQADYNFKKIAEYAATLQGGIILSGDFNLFKEAPSLQPLKDIGLTNLNDVYGITEARNEFAWKTNEAVSHIFISDQILVHEYRIPTDNVSDHLPLVLRFGLNK